MTFRVWFVYVKYTKRTDGFIAESITTPPGLIFRFLDSCDALADQYHGEDQKKDAHYDRVVLAQPGLPAVQDRLGLLAHCERDHEGSGHAEHGDEYVDRDGPHILPS